jgi:hypothetical protein
MKKIIFIISITFLAFSSQAQGTLQFNQVLLLTLTSQGDTVPQGKVWKVESSVSTVPDLQTAGESYFFVNGAKAEIHQLSYWFNSNANPNSYNTINFSSTFSSTTTFPMWLPEGTIVTLGDLVSALSIIEFNIE